VTLDDIEHFAAFTGDTFYAHLDEAAARANPFFDGRVAHGYLVLAFAAGLFVQPDPGPVLANYGIDNLRFLAPVYPGDELTVALTCKQISPRDGEFPAPGAAQRSLRSEERTGGAGTGGYGEVRWDAVVTKQDGTVVAAYDVLTMVAKEWTP
jgi:oxepin-CoA hydrolase/3-oxo-5,6-dehydrosuberyl-CoA semialdehyde dehydrogenase